MICRMNSLKCDFMKTSSGFVNLYISHVMIRKIQFSDFKRHLLGITQNADNVLFVLEKP